MAMKKHFIETYKNYKIFIVSGTSPVLFIAEKDNPAKGPTLTAGNLDQLKTDIDNVLDYALSVKINIYEGPSENKVFQNPNTHIRSNSGIIDGFTIVIESNYDLDIIIEMLECKPVRRSKKHNKSRHSTRSASSFVRILCRNKTTVIERQ